ncbi:MAG: DUF1697 domain-containing protein [Deltaproteobacteria bacterium]|nr:DUF1697 domain-containing protein [Deltaproteobacteria bacterium]
MGRYVALMRGINVGGKNKLPMKDLVAIFEAAGCAEVKTYIQSGNVVFSAPAKVAKGLAEAVPEAISAQFGLRVPVVLRSAADYLAAVEANPFLAEGVPAGRSTWPSSARSRRRPGWPSWTRRAHRRTRSAWWGCKSTCTAPTGWRTRSSRTRFDSTLGVVSTARNWRTVLTLAGMLEA